MGDDDLNITEENESICLFVRTGLRLPVLAIRLIQLPCLRTEIGICDETKPIRAFM